MYQIVRHTHILGSDITVSLDFLFTDTTDNICLLCGTEGWSRRCRENVIIIIHKKLTAHNLTSRITLCIKFVILSILL